MEWLNETIYKEPSSNFVDKLRNLGFVGVHHSKNEVYYIKTIGDSLYSKGQLTAKIVCVESSLLSLMNYVELSCSIQRYILPWVEFSYTVADCNELDQIVKEATELYIQLTKPQDKFYKE